MWTLPCTSVSIHLRSRHTDWHTTLDCAVLSNITGTTPSTQLDTISWNLPKDIKVADEHFDQPGSIDIFIGADVFFEIPWSGRRTRPGNYPVLQETVLGWTLAGQTPAVTQNSPQRTFLLRDDNSLEHNQLGSSRLSAERRLLAIERRLERDTNLKNQYHQFMKEYEELGHKQPVTTHEKGLGATAQRTCLPTGASGFYHCDCVPSDTSSSTRLEGTYSMSTNTRRHHSRILQAIQAHQSHCILQKIH